jgi:hypothetical protein
MKYLTSDENANAIVTYDDGHEVTVYASSIVNNNVNLFEGWSCEAGVSRIFVLPDLTVWSGECQNDYLGSLTDDFNLFIKPTVCKQKLCLNNPDDLAIKKMKN